MAKSKFHQLNQTDNLQFRVYMFYVQFIDLPLECSFYAVLRRIDREKCPDNCVKQLAGRHLPALPGGLHAVWL